MLYLIGLGLSDEFDVTLKGQEAIKNSEKVYLESYTSQLSVQKEKLEQFYGKDIQVVGRSFVENGLDALLEEAKEKIVSLLIIGDVFAATTHSSILLEAKEKQVPVKIIHNASILNHIADSGLSLYKFGKISSLPFDHSRVDVVYQNLVDNKDMHSLILLDLDPLENSFLEARTAINYLLEKEKEFQKEVFSEESLCVICAKMGSSEEVIKVGKARDLLKVKIEVFPQCLIVPGKLHFMEEDLLKTFQ